MNSAEQVQNVQEVEVKSKLLLREADKRGIKFTFLFCLRITLKFTNFIVAFLRELPLL